MDQLSIILLMILYYIRPQEWVPGMGSTRPVALTLVFGMGALLMRKEPLSLRGFFRAPHDWFMFGFLAYLIYYAPSSHQAFGEMKNRLVMYVLIVQGLNSVKRLSAFVWWWTALILSVALLAVLSEYGFDPTGARQYTHALKMEGRLCLGTSIFQNPNALGHSIVPLAPMLFHLCFWRRPLAIKEIGLTMLAVPMYCLYLTRSKGSFIALAGTLMVAMFFGRPLLVQSAVWAAGAYGGKSVILRMPRMSVIRRGDPKALDEGIWGRWVAFKYGLGYFDSRKHGLGFGRFIHHMQRDAKIWKAAHCSYVEVGAELGKRGLYLWLGILYCCLRTIVTARCRTVEEERIRRVLFAAIIAYMFSSWFTNISYRGTFFIQAAACCAFHRVLRDRDLAEAEADEADPDAPPADPPDAGANAEPTAVELQGVPPGETPLHPSPLFTRITGLPVPPPPPGTHQLPQEPPPPPPKRMAWRIITPIDLFLAYVLFKIVHRCWAWVVFNL